MATLPLCQVCTQPCECAAPLCVLWLRTPARCADCMCWRVACAGPLAHSASLLEPLGAWRMHALRRNPRINVCTDVLFVCSR